jgi:N-acetylglucosaminyl-diphospho-decaprenol L-rhamnosyltransferase
MTEKRPYLSIVMVNWNTREDLAGCLRAIPEAVEGIRYEVIVIDNHSMDGSQEMLNLEFPWVTALSLRKNLGYAVGVNMGIRSARGSHVLLLNPDSVPTRGALATLVGYLESHPETDILGGRLIGRNGTSHMEAYYVPFPTFSSALFQYTSLVRISRCLHLPPERLCDTAVRQVPGACLLARRDTMEEVGPFDEGFFVWFEDVDWCFRAHLKGKGLAICEEALFVHEGGRSFQGLSDWTRKKLFYRSLLRYFRKHHGKTRWIALGGVLVAEQTIAILISGALAVVFPREKGRLRRAGERLEYLGFLVRAFKDPSYTEGLRATPAKGIP